MRTGKKTSGWKAISPTGIMETEDLVTWPVVPIVANIYP